MAQIRSRNRQRMPDDFGNLPASDPRAQYVAEFVNCLHAHPESYQDGNDQQYLVKTVH